MFEEAGNIVLSLTVFQTSKSGVLFTVQHGMVRNGPHPCLPPSAYASCVHCFTSLRHITATRVIYSLTTAACIALLHSGYIFDWETGSATIFINRRQVILLPYSVTRAKPARTSPLTTLPLSGPYS